MIPLLSIILPSYNNGRILPSTIRRIGRVCPRNTEVIVVVDGSRDGTLHILSQLRLRHPRVRVLARTDRRGKGAAVRDGVLAARGHFIGLIDADMAIDPSAVAQGLKLLRQNRHLNAVIARRTAYHTGGLRAVLHVVFHWVEYLLFRMPYHDTQAPMKVFRANVAKAVFRRLQTRSYAFDIEVLFRTMIRGNGVVELPVLQRKTRSSLRWSLLLFSTIEMLRMYRTYIAHIAIRLLTHRDRRSPFMDLFTLRHLLFWPLSWPLLWILEFLYRFVEKPLPIQSASLPSYPRSKPALTFLSRAS